MIHSNSSNNFSLLKKVGQQFLVSAVQHHLSESCNLRTDRLRNKPDIFFTEDRSWLDAAISSLLLYSVEYDYKCSPECKARKTKIFPELRFLRAKKWHSKDIN